MAVGASVSTAASGLPGHCEWDQCRPLTGRQKRFATDACRAAWHDSIHPRINPVEPSLRRKASIRSIVLGILQDGEWHTAHDLAIKAHADKHSVVSRISQLKRSGHRIETDLPRGNVSRPHRYRLVA